MKRVIRDGVFETNSSTQHSIVILSEDNYNRWKEDDGLYVLKDYYYTWKGKKASPEIGKLYTRDEIRAIYEENGDDYWQEDDDAFMDWLYEDDWLKYEGFITYEDWRELELEQDENEFTSPSGDKMVALCAYGYDY